MEYFSNKLFSGMPFEDAPGEKGYITKLIEAVADKMGKSKQLQEFVNSYGGKALGWITDKVGEGLEEVVTGLLDPAIDWVTYDPDAKIDSLAEEFVGGFVLAMLMTGGEALIDNVNSTRTGKDYNLDKDTVQALLAEAKSLPQLQADPAETRRIYEALGLEVPGTQNAAPEGAAESIRAGQVTVIQHPYSGAVPVQESVSPSVISVPDASVQRANALINTAENAAAQGAGSVKTTLTRLYQQIFQRSSGIPIDGLTFQGKQYLVEIGNKVPVKVISDPNLSAEKLALLDDLPQVVKHAEYVGSAQYLPNAKSKNSAIRYDYFETPVKINGKSYIAKFDVEVIPGANNYRTHQIVNVDLTSAEARLVGPAPTPSSDVPSLRNENISQQASAVNRSTGDSVGDTLTSSVFPEQETDYYAVFGLERPKLAANDWTENADGDIVDATSESVTGRPHDWAEPNPRMKRPTQHGFEAFPEGDRLKEYVRNVKPMEGYFDVAMHGQVDGVCFGTDRPSMTARELARTIQHDPSYDGGPIRLLCCDVGKPGMNGEYCFAEELANALGVEALASDNKLYIFPNGVLRIGMSGGKMRRYLPNQRGRMG